jgi:hypothetical protein
MDKEHAMSAGDSRIYFRLIWLFDDPCSFGDGILREFVFHVDDNGYSDYSDGRAVPVISSIEYEQLSVPCVSTGISNVPLSWRELLPMGFG